MESIIGKEEVTDTSIIDISNDWTALDEVCISWKKVWDLEYTLNFGNDAEEKFSGGRDGSVIARYRKYNAIYSTKSIEIYDYKGIRLYEYEIRLETDNLFFYVTSDDHLIVLTTSGYLLTFFAGREISRIKIIDKNVEIMDADFWDEGLVFLTKERELYYAPSYKKPHLIQNLSKHFEIMNKMKVIPPKDGQLLTVLITDASDHIFIVNETQVIVHVLKEGMPIDKFSINSNYTNIAFICGLDGNLLLIVTELDPQILALEKFLERREELPLQLSWCGCDFPMITYENSVNILLYNGQLLEMKKDRYPFSGCSWVFQSSTYSLVFSSGALFKLNSISDELFNAIRRDSKVMSSMNLVNAFLKRSSEGALTMKREGTLKDAMTKCIQASYQVDSPQIQQLFMFSANFARTYLDLTDNCDEFFDDIKKMRFANSFANELNVVVLPTYPSDIIFQKILLYRICNRKRFSLALKIADYLSIDKQFIITEWCLSMAYENQNDDTALRFISSKYRQNEQLFEINAIATALSKEGRLNLAKRVAELDPCKMNVVPFFISCGMWEEALNAAKNSYDSTLFVETFNKAVDNKLEDIAINVVKKDRVMYLNIAKLVTQEDYKSINEIEVKCPTYVSDRVKAYMRVIKENFQAFNPPSLNEFVDKLKVSKSNFHKGFKGELPENKTKNEILEKMILDIDYDDVNNINEFIKGFIGSSSGLFKKSNTDKYYVMIATVLAKHKMWKQFLALADNSFSKYHYHYVSIALCNFGSDHALEFIHHVHDVKKAKLLEEYLNNSNPVEQFESLIAKDIHFRFFH